METAALSPPSGRTDRGGISAALRLRDLIASPLGGSRVTSSAVVASLRVTDLDSAIRFALVVHDEIARGSLARTCPGRTPTDGHGAAAAQPAHLVSR